MAGHRRPGLGLDGEEAPKRAMYISPPPSCWVMLWWDAHSLRAKSFGSSRLGTMCIVMGDAKCMVIPCGRCMDIGVEGSSYIIFPVLPHERGEPAGTLHIHITGDRPQFFSIIPTNDQHIACTTVNSKCGIAFLTCTKTMCHDENGHSIPMPCYEGQKNVMLFTRLS